MDLLYLIQKHKKGLVLLASLLLIENIAWIIEPTVFGNLLDAFIRKVHRHKIIFSESHLKPLFIWIGIYLINSLSGFIRRRLEPKIFQNMYVNIVTNINMEGKKRRLETSKIAARAQLSQEYITFLQYRSTEFIEQSIAITGAIIALGVFDWRISLACSVVAIPVLTIAFFYYRKVSHLQSDLHDSYERTYDAFSHENQEKVKETYQSMAKAQEGIGKWSAFNFGSMRMILLFIFIVVLYISIDLDNFTTGKIYSIVAYLWTFVSSVEYLPDLMESWTSLGDITKRLKSAN